MVSIERIDQIATDALDYSKEEGLTVRGLAQAAVRMGHEAAARTAVPDAATERFECDRNCVGMNEQIEDCSAHGRTPRDLWEQIDKVVAERDAALAEIESRIEDRDYWYGIADKAKSQRDAANEDRKQTEAEIRDLLKVDIPSLKAERDAALAAVERVRALLARKSTAGSGFYLNPDRTELDMLSDLYSDRFADELVAALDGAPEPERLSIPIPNVPFGPEGVAPNIATASYLIEVVKKLDFGYANVGGSNVTATLRKLLVDTAEALRSLPVEGEKP